MKKLIAVCTTALLAVGLAVSGAGVASATNSAPEPCVPSDAWTETIPGTPGSDAVYETAVVAEAGWQRYSWTGGPWESDEAPAFPGEWQANVAGDPHGVGVEGAYFRSHGNSGNGDWFYLEATPEVTEEVLVTEAVLEVPESYIDHPAVVCEDEIPAPKECVVTYGDWFTEGDDTAPTENEDGLLFVGGVNDAMGVGIGIGGNLQGLPTITYDVEADAYSLSKFYPRIVIDSSADGGSSYNSMTVTSEGPVDGSSIASGKLTNGSRVAQTLDEWAAYYPNNTLRFFFLGTDSGSNADVSVLLKSVTSDCFSDTWGYGSQPEDKVVISEWVDGAYECGATEVEQTRNTTTTAFTLVDGVWVEGEPVVGETETQIRQLTDEEIVEAACPVVIPEEPVVETPEEPVVPVVDRAPIAKADVLAYTGSNDVDLAPFGIAAAIMVLLGSAMVAARRFSKV